MGESTFAAKQGDFGGQDSLLESAPIAVPKPKPARTHAIDPAHVTASDIVDPHGSPSLDTVDKETLLKLIEDELPNIFDELRKAVTSVTTRLAAPRPPADESTAVAILSIFVELVAGAAIGEVGRRIAGGMRGAFGEDAGTATSDAMKAVSAAESPNAPTAVSSGPVTESSGAAPTAPTTKSSSAATNTASSETGKSGSSSATSDAIKVVAKSQGAAAGTWFKTHAVDAPHVAAHENHTAERGGTLLDEFATRERLSLNGKQSAARAALAILRSALPQTNRGSLQALHSDLTALSSDPRLIGWFEEKLTMEWQNFRARLALEEHPEDLGTNSITTSVNASAALRRLDGFVDITINTAEQIHGVDGLSVARVNVDLPAAAEILRDSERTLANVPMYRRVWVTRGSSKITAEPVMLVAPDGEIQADLKSPILAAIGGGDSTSFLDATTKESSRNIAATVVNAASAAQGARSIMGLLAKSRMELAQ